MAGAAKNISVLPDISRVLIRPLKSKEQFLVKDCRNLSHPKGLVKITSDALRITNEGAEKKVCKAGSDGDSSPSLRIAFKLFSSLDFLVSFLSRKKKLPARHEGKNEMAETGLNLYDRFFRSILTQNIYLIR